MNLNIGFIGLGNMGLPMALNLRKAGHTVYGKNRSPGKERQFAEQGGKTGLAVSRLAAEMDVVITCLPMPSDVEDVYFAPDGLLASAREGLLLIDCSTVSPELSRRCFAEAERRGADFLDAPVSGGTTGAAAASLSVMVGGKRQAFERAKPVFEAVGKQIYYVGEAGSGSAVKLINQLMVGIHSQAVGEAFALGRRLGVDPDLLYAILTQSFAQSRMLERHYSQFISKNRYEPGFALKLLGKDLNLAAETAAAFGVGLPAGGRVQAILNRAAASGYGDLDMAGLYAYQLAMDEKRREAGPLKHFAVFLPMLDAEKSALYREEHLRFLDERRADGMLFANGRFADGAGGLVIYRGRSYEEVEQWVKRDPYVVKGARRYEIHEWEIVPADN